MLSHHHAAMPSSWKVEIKEALWAQRLSFSDQAQGNEHSFAPAVPVLVQTLQRAYLMCQGNVPVFTNMLQRLCVVEKTKAYFKVGT